MTIDIETIKATVRTRLTERLSPPANPIGAPFDHGDYIIEELAEDLIGFTRVNAFYNPYPGVPEDPSELDCYIAAITANGWVENNIYTYIDGDWRETEFEPGLTFAYVVAEDNYFGAYPTGWEELSIGSNLDDYVTLTTPQNISGKKTFSQGIGIGTDDPQNMLHIDGSSSPGLQISSGFTDGDDGLSINLEGSLAVYKISYTGSHIFAVETDPGVWGVGLTIQDTTSHGPTCNMAMANIGSPTGGSMGAGSLNAEALYVNGEAIWHSGNLDPDDYALVSHDHSASDINSGTLSDSRLSFNPDYFVQGETSRRSVFYSNTNPLDNNFKSGFFYMYTTDPANTTGHNVAGMKAQLPSSENFSFEMIARPNENKLWFGGLGSGVRQPWREIWHSGNLDPSDYYTKTNLQTSGQSSVNWGNITGAPSFITGVNWNGIGGSQSSVNISGFNNDAGYLTSLGFDISDYVTLTTPQNISGKKTFSQGMGIGTDDPQNMLHIDGSNPGLQISNGFSDNEDGLTIKLESNAVVYGVSYNRGHKFKYETTPGVWETGLTIEDTTSGPIVEMPRSIVGDPTDGAKEAGSLNAEALYVNGEAIWHSGNFDPSDKIDVPTEINGIITAAAGPVWVTIATVNTGRAHGEFYVYDSDSGDQDFVKIIANTSYGQNRISCISGNAFGRTSSIAIVAARMLYKASGRTYGGAALQVLVTEPLSLLRVIITNNKINKWDAWGLITPQEDDLPSGWAVDETTVTDGIEKYSFVGDLSGRNIHVQHRTANDIVYGGMLLSVDNNGINYLQSLDDAWGSDRPIRIGTENSTGLVVTSDDYYTEDWTDETSSITIYGISTFTTKIWDVRYEGKKRVVRFKLYGTGTGAGAIRVLIDYDVTDVDSPEQHSRYHSACQVYDNGYPLTVPGRISAIYEGEGFNFINICSNWAGSGFEASPRGAEGLFIYYVK